MGNTHRIKQRNVKKRACAAIKSVGSVPGEVGSGAACKSVLTACSRHRLLPNERNHLSNVDRGTF